MKKLLAILPVVAVLAGCSGMTEIPDRKTYAQPSWYQRCAQSGTEGWLWWTKDMVYSCGAGVSLHSQAAEEQTYAIAMNNFAKRINSEVNSETHISFDNDKKNTRSVISYQVRNTVIREHIQQESGHFTMGGRHFSFVRLKMPKEVFDRLIQEARNQ
jgi:hypothetical protein